jgi:Helix-turn-helix domain
MKRGKLGGCGEAGMCFAIWGMRMPTPSSLRQSWRRRLSRRWTEHLTVRGAHGRTGIAAADFSRIRNANLGRFTVDRLMSIINRLGSRVEVKVRVRRSAEALAF